MVDDIRPRPDRVQNDPSDKFAAPPQPASPQVNDKPIEINMDEPVNIRGREEGFVLAQKSPEESSGRDLLWPLAWWRKATKKQRIIAAAVIATILFALGGTVYALTNKDVPAPPPPPAPVEKKVEKPKTTEPSRLTGVEISKETNKRHVTAVQIENSPDARPQAGLREAGIVFEAIAEGGITRFNALFLEGQPDYIGPVRSIRPYFIDFFMPFDAPLVHAGGSHDGLVKLAQLGAKDLDHSNTGGAFRRVSDRYAPHNLYTSMAELDKAVNAKGFTKSTFKSWPRKKEAPTKKVTAGKIDLNISGPLYSVHYDYDSKTNSYHRSMAGRAHNDHKSGKVITPKVVMVLAMNWSQNGIYSVYQTTGSGPMYVFQDGLVHKGTWKKAGPKDQFEFIGSDNKPLALNPGQTWVSIVRSINDASATP